MSSQKSPRMPFVIDADADARNADWLRIIAKRRKQQQEIAKEKEQPANGQRQPL